MKPTCVIFGHPNLKGGSLSNLLILESLPARPELEVRILSELYPDQRVDVAKEQAALVKAQRLVLQFPFYWYSAPGLMKNWMDQVLTFGFAYGSQGDKLKGKELLLSLTVGGPAMAYGPEGYNRFTMDQLLAPFQQTARLTGMLWQEPLLSHGMVNIPGAPLKKEEVTPKAKAHAQRLLDWLEA